MHLRRVLRQIAPPALVALMRRLNPEWRYVGTEPALLDSSGWQHDSVTATQLRKWPQWQAIVSSKQPLGVAHEAPVLVTDNIAAHNILLTFAYVLALASRTRSSLNVLDWGGGLGHYATVARALLPAELELRYTVFEVPGTAAAGRTLQNGVTFVDSGAPLQPESFDVVVASGSVQFVSDWRELLATLTHAARDYLYIARIPLVRRAKSFIAIQRAHRYGYHTAYHGWCLNAGELVSAVQAAGGELVREFALEPHSHVVGAPEQPVSAGFLFRKQ